MTPVVVVIAEDDGEVHVGVEVGDARGRDPVFEGLRGWASVPVPQRPSLAGRRGGLLLPFR